MGFVGRLLARLTGTGELPPGFASRLEASENVLAVADLRGGGHLVATSLGLWLPEGEDAHRAGWHLISKATWSNGALTVVVADEVGTAGGAVLLTDRAPRRFVLAEPRKVPQVVHARVTGSIRSRHHKELPGGGAWFVQRRVPGRDGVVLQVRPDPGTDVQVVADLAAEVAARMGRGRRSGA